MTLTNSSLSFIPVVPDEDSRLLLGIRGSAAENGHADTSGPRWVHLYLRWIEFVLARHQANDFVFRGISDDTHGILSFLHRFDTLPK